MAITKRQGVVKCALCDARVAVFFLSASNMQRQLEALPVGWAEWAERYVCGDHDEAPGSYDAQVKAIAKGLNSLVDAAKAGDHTVLEPAFRRDWPDETGEANNAG